MTATAYAAQLQALLPPGRAFTRAPDAILTKLLFALAEEFARLDARVDALAVEIDPTKTSELIDEFEDMLGLPDVCIGDLSSLDGRRIALRGRLTATGGQSRQYFIDLAASVGYAITIDEPALHTWQINASGAANVARAGFARAGDPLRTWGSEKVLECTLARYAPAHAVLIFNYT